MNRQLAALLLALAYARTAGAGPIVTAVVFGSTKLNVEVADTPAKHARGLMDRDSLSTDAGMLFVYPAAEPHEFWMKDTLIPLSIAFLDDSGKIINVIDEMVPMDITKRYPSKAPARYAVEANKNWFKNAGIKAGDTAQFVYRSEKIEGVGFGSKMVKVETVDRPETVEKGLMNRDHLDENAGMLFMFPRPQVMRFWMKNTRIPLSIAFLDTRRKVLNIRDMEPFDIKTRHVSEGQAIYALEVNKGWFERAGVKPGDVARFLQSTTEKTGAPGAEAGSAPW